MIRFHDRRDAGKRLAARMHHMGVVGGANAAERERSLAVVVLGIPRGGVPVAAQIARELDAPLDVFITRKIGAPFNPELALGAVASDGTVFLDQGLIHQLHIPQQLVDMECEQERREIQRRAALYRRDKPPLVLENKVVILADDGIATGATTIAALRAVRHSHPARTILAVPVAPREVVPHLRAECDELVILDSPEPFIAVGYFYENFDQVTDAEVVQMLG